MIRDEMGHWILSYTDLVVMDFNRRAAAFILGNSVSGKQKALLQKINFYFAVTEKLSHCKTSNFLCRDDYVCWHKHLGIPCYCRHGERKKKNHSLRCFLPIYFTFLSGITKTIIMHILLFYYFAIIIYTIITLAISLVIEQWASQGKTTEVHSKEKRTVVKRKQDEKLHGVYPGSITISKFIQNMTALCLGFSWLHKLDSPELCLEACKDPYVWLFQA